MMRVAPAIGTRLAAHAALRQEELVCHLGKRSCPGSSSARRSPHAMTSSAPVTGLRRRSLVVRATHDRRHRGRPHPAATTAEAEHQRTPPAGRRRRLRGPSTLDLPTGPAARSFRAHAHPPNAATVHARRTGGPAARGADHVHRTQLARLVSRLGPAAPGLPDSIPVPAGLLPAGTPHPVRTVVNHPRRPPCWSRTASQWSW